MKGRIARVSSNSIQHVYQRAVDHGVIFYTIEDRLVYYTIYASKARKHDIKVCAAAIMYTHTHQSCISPSLKHLQNYLHDSGTSFSRLYNYRYGRKGPLLERRPGMSQKSTLKSQRANLLYVFNNHVEKGICRSASEERWSFLAYADNQFPFSRPIETRKISKNLIKAIRLVKRRAKRMKALEYADLDRILSKLDIHEKEQFIDYVISEYAWIDFSVPIGRFGSIESLRMAADSTTGSEYDIIEDYCRHSDRSYITMCEEAKRREFSQSIFKMSTSERINAACEIARKYCFPMDQIRSFFHINLNGN